MADDVIALVDLDPDRRIRPAREQPLDPVAKRFGSVAAPQKHLLNRVDIAVIVSLARGHNRLGDHEPTEEPVAQVQRILAHFAVPCCCGLARLTLLEIKAADQAFNRGTHERKGTDGGGHRGNADPRPGRYCGLTCGRLTVCETTS